MPSYVITNCNGDNLKHQSGYKSGESFAAWLDDSSMFKQPKKEVPPPEEKQPEERRPDRKKKRRKVDDDSVVIFTVPSFSQTIESWKYEFNA